jgi:hypothetical protein
MFKVFLRVSSSFFVLEFEDEAKDELHFDDVFFDY